MDSNNMGIFLLDLRKRKNLTQKDVAMLCNVSTQAVSKWERGESIPDIEILEKLSILYDISINELINGEKREIFIDVDRRKLIISLTFSVLVFFAYLFSFVHIPVYEITTFYLIYKGYEILSQGISGNIIIASWVVFLILISYLITNIFILARVMDRTKKYYAYMLFSYIIIILVALIGLIEYYLLLPQAIIVICSTIIFTQSWNKSAFNFEHIKSFFKQMVNRIISFNKNIHSLKKNYLFEKSGLRDVKKYKISSYFKPIVSIPFIVLYLSVIVIMILVITGNIITVIQEPSFLTNSLIIFNALLIIGVLYQLYSIRYLSTVMFGLALSVIWIVHFIFLLFCFVVYSSSLDSIWIFIIPLVILIIYFFYSRKLLATCKLLSRQ